MEYFRGEEGQGCSQMLLILFYLWIVENQIKTEQKQLAS